MGELLTPDEVAKRLKVKKKTIYAWLGQGKLKGTKLGDLWRIDEKDLQEFIEAGKKGE